MSYMHIDNLYKDTTILMFRECYAMEKIHGTSAHVHYKPKGMEGVMMPAEVKFFSGGSSSIEFAALFDKDKLLEKLSEIPYNVWVYGEAYGGKCQGMSATYGNKLMFVGFEVKIGDKWLNVQKADDFTRGLSLDFVHYIKCSTDLDALDEQRDSPSVQAIKNGMRDSIDRYGCNPPIREGIVLHPLEEMTMNNGSRVIAKHKSLKFSETKTEHKVGDPQVLSDARRIADEWVTEERMNHVLDALQPEMKVESIGAVIKAMTDDVFREAGIEVTKSKAADKEIGRATALMFKRRLSPNNE